MTGSYKLINSENSSTECLNDSSPSPEGEKKEEPRRFLDKLKGKSKNKNGSDENIKAKEPEVIDFDKYMVFGCELSRVEKDVENPNVPKFVVECIKLLNRDENIKAAGIYRASGNKNSIEAVKKKINDKKYSKVSKFFQLKKKKKSMFLFRRTINIPSCKARISTRYRVCLSFTSGNLCQDSFRLRLFSFVLEVILDLFLYVLSSKL